MGELTLLSDYGLDTTILSNIYIDEYMVANNEAQVKIYLYLLRNLRSGKGVSVCSIADFFNYTVQDVERALLYMQNQGLMALATNDNGICGIRILPLESRKSKSRAYSSELERNPVSENSTAKKEVVMFSSKPEYSKKEIIEFSKRPEIEELIFVAEQYIGKSLVVEDIQNLYYMNKTLNFSEEVIEYLIEYCVGLNKKSFAYISKVAESFKEANVTTVEEAKQYTMECPKEIYSIFKAYGIKSLNRKPQAGEIRFAKKWYNEYGFKMDVIELACVRTVEKTHSVSFEYTDAILKDWKNKGVTCALDVEKIDEQFKSANMMQSSNTDSSKKVQSKQEQKKAKNTFSEFSHRNYDYDELEKQFLSKKG